MRNPEKTLTIALRFVGVLDLLALLAIALPEAWMAAAHQGLGMGTLPAIPLVGYLARSASGLYAMNGATLLFMSCDVRRYRAMIRFVGRLASLFGLTMLLIDISEGMPWWWTLIEGPGIMGLAVLVLVLESQLESNAV